MAKNDFIQKRNQRLLHIRELLSINHENTIRCVEKNLGDPTSCVMMLASNAQAKAMICWFEQQDIRSTMQWFYVAGKLNQLSYQMKSDTFNPGLKNFELLDPLISNNKDLISWYTNCDLIYDMKRVEKSSTDDFFAYQSIVALRGDWSRLFERCKQIIDNPPPSLKRWQEYHYFYLALAEQDLAKMEYVLQEMVEPKKVRSRCGEETGITENLIFSRVIIAMKIAWLHGFEVKVDSPYVPMAWMPMAPLTQYDNFYSFLK